jgi:hypothetical protein
VQCHVPCQHSVVCSPEEPAAGLTQEVDEAITVGEYVAGSDALWHV